MSQQIHKVMDIMNEVKKVIIGKDECIQRIMTAILAKGHILMEDIPGVGKTTLSLAFSKSMALITNRVSFTPDVLPSDVVGFTMYSKSTGQFRYQPGPIMCNIFLADEINRTSPKTQSALLEVMEEGNVTIDGITHEVPKPFTVIATQNPVGSAGTQLLPESQLDRFMICISIGYPDLSDEIEIMKGGRQQESLAKVRTILQGNDLVMLQQEVETVFIHDSIYEYIGQLAAATRNHPLIELGVSPRGTIAVSRMIKAHAYLLGRDYALPSDVSDVLKNVCTHRIRLNSKARINQVSADDILDHILEEIKGPSVRRK